MIEPRCDSLPSQFVQLVVDATYKPYVPLHRGDCEIAVGEEIVSAEMQNGPPRVVEGRLNGVQGVGFTFFRNA